MANIVDKYFNKKKKQIYDYCKYINRFITYDSNQLWKDSTELNELIKSSVSLYVNKYYFKSLEEFDEYNEYLGPLVKCDNRFKTILVCSINSASNKTDINNYKNSIYIMSLIIYTAVVLNRFTYPYNNYRITVKNVTSIINPMFSSNNFIKYTYSAKTMAELTSEIKKNDNLESKFFTSLNALNNESSKNLYESVDKDDKYYEVKYEYSIPELNNYKTKHTEKYLKRISDDLNSISYELASTAILKSKMLDKSITLLFPVDLKFYEKESQINKLFKILSNDCIKESIKFYANYDDFKDHTSIIRILYNSGFQVALNIKGAREVPYGIFNEIKTAVIDLEFYEKNKSNLETWKNNGVSFIERNNKEAISELKMLGLEEEK